MRIISAILLLLSFSGLADPTAAAVDELTHEETLQHEKAIALAREAQWPDALSILAELRRSHPENEPLLVDQAVVLAWSGQNDEAARLAATLDPVNVPEYALGVLAKAFRNNRDFDQAIAWYRAMVERSPDNLDARRGLVMTLADAGSSEQLKQAISETPGDMQQEPGFLSAEAYALEREGRYLDAVRAYDRILELQPDNRDAWRSKALSLRSLLLPRQALTIAYDHPGVLTDDEIAQLEADIIALELRFASQATYPEDRRYDAIDRALIELETQLGADDLTPAARQRLIFDRIVSLGDRLRTREAIEAYEALELPIDEVPTYVLAGAGTSYLQERQPERALELLEAAVARSPDNIDYKFRLFFVYADLERHDDALELAESLLAEIDPVKQQPGSPVVKASHSYLRAAILKGLATAYSDRLNQSQDHFERLLERMPNNTEVRSELATIYRWRGWIDRSMHEYAQVLAVDPAFMPAAVGYAYSKIDGQYFETVAEDIDTLNRNYPDQAAVQNLDARWRVQNRSELRVDASVGQNSGNTFGQDQFNVDAIWLSRPIQHRFRVLLSAHDAFAEFPEGEARRRRIGAGLDYRFRRWTARASVTATTAGEDAGLRSFVSYRLNDVLRLGARFETESNATPLRGARVGVSSTLVGTEAIWQPHESTRVDAGIELIDLSDGNRTLALRAAGEHRLVNLLTYDLSGLASIDVIRNDDDNVSYFSPIRSVVWTAGLRNEHQIFRRYDFALAHSLTARVGQHIQKFYGSDAIWNIEYRFNADINDRMYTYIGISRASNVYDGDREYRTAGIAGFGGRF